MLWERFGERLNFMVFGEKFFFFTKNNTWETVAHAQNMVSKPPNQSRVRHLECDFTFYFFLSLRIFLYFSGFSKFSFLALKVSK